MNVNIGLLGCGTVGAGVIELARRREDRIAEMTGLRPAVTRVLVRDLGKPRAVPLEGERLTNDPQEIIGDETIRVVIETIGGIEPARSLILQAIRAGKHVITANKDLIALHGTEILAAAEEARVDVLYEAAVGGAIPLIRPLRESLTANEITDIKGIVNGTTNFILSKMTETGADFADVLREAQELGYAEADPSSDVDGLDAARKLTILASIAFHTSVNLADVKVTGIRSITAKDVYYAHELGAVVKLLAAASDLNGELALRVRPALIPQEHPLAHVSDAYNALYVRGDASGDLMFFGRGAGSLPTASAVIGDVIEVLRNISQRISGRVRTPALSHKPVNHYASEPVRHYLRLTVANRPGVFAHIAGIFGDAGISMETVLQKRVDEENAEVVIVTHEVSEARFDGVLGSLRDLPDLARIESAMPVERGAY